ncbi:uncharacterized protein LOC106705933 isoform X2 [Latimeria chalumnae]|uniref:uncharacterized protein LOC106705933 isoform X2 n=1 Tax=Latimeria chalumnae TaxID=7897 RepID=UPI00313ED917
MMKNAVFEEEEEDDVENRKKCVHVQCEELTPSGGSKLKKKFLYNGPPKKVQERDEKKKQVWRDESKDEKTTVNLDEIWSIKKNISLGSMKPMSQTTSKLHPNTDYYSRYGGMKSSSGKGYHVGFKTTGFHSHALQKHLDRFLPNLTDAAASNNCPSKSLKHQENTINNSEIKDEFDF